MAYELDHFFIFTDVGAPEAERLIQFGLSEGAPNTHPGQGTSNRRFFFHNCFLELVWVHNAQEAQSEMTRPVHLWERWRGRLRDTSPFGLVFRSREDASAPPPFSTWQYRPAYLPPPLCIEVGLNAEVYAEPALFYLSFGRRADSFPQARLQPLAHQPELREVTHLRLISPHRNHSPEMQAVINADLISCEVGGEPLLELTFDSGAKGQRADFRPALPLIFLW